MSANPLEVSSALSNLLASSTPIPRELRATAADILAAMPKEMAKLLGSVEAQSRACLTITSLLADKNTSMVVLSSPLITNDVLEGIVTSIVASMLKFKQNDAYNITAVNTLRIMSRTPAGVDAVNKGLAMDPIIHCMARFINMAKIQEACAATLTNICFGSDERKQEFANFKGIRAVTKSLKTFKKDPEVILRDLILLRNVTAGVPANQTTAGHEGATSVCVDLVRDINPEKYPSIRHQAFGALANITSSPETVRELSGADAVPTLLDGLRTSPESLLSNLSFAEDVLTLFRNLAQYNETIRDPLGEMGGVSDIMTLAEKHPTENSIALRVCQFMRYMCFTDQNRETMRHCSGLEFIITNLNDHVEDDEVTEAALLALANGTFRNPENKDLAIALGAVDATIRAMEIHHKKSNIVERSLRLLRNLIPSEPVDDSFLHKKDDQVIKRCNLALIEFRENPPVLEQALATLVNLGPSDANIAVMEEKEVINQIVKISSTYSSVNENIGMQCDILLNLLEAPPKGIFSGSSQRSTMKTSTNTSSFRTFTRGNTSTIKDKEQKTGLLSGLSMRSKTKDKGKTK